MSSTTGAASVETMSTLEIKLENLPCMVAGVYSNDSSMQQEATTLIRKLLCIEGNPPIEEVIQSGVVHLFSEFSTREGFPLLLQIEASLALMETSSICKNIGLASHHYMSVPFFVMLLANCSCEKAVYWLGKIACRSRRFRHLVLSQGALIPLLSHLEHANANANAKLSMLRNATFTLLNFCQGQPHPAFDLTKAAVVAAVKGVVVNSNDEEVLTNTCWALAYLCADANKIQAVIEAGFCQRLVQLLQHPSPCVVIPALVTVGNILKDVQTYQVTGLITSLADQTADIDIKNEFAWGISKATTGGNNEQIKYLVDRGCIKPLCNLLSCPDDPRIVSVCLQALENILEAGEELERKNLEADDLNSFAQIIDEAGGLDKIENLETHDNHEINEKALKILETYYWLEEEEDDDDDDDEDEDEDDEDDDDDNDDIISSFSFFNFL